MSVLGILAGWTLVEVVGIHDARALQAGIVVWGLAFVGFALGFRYRVPTLRRVGLVLLGSLYFGLHVLVAPLSLIPALVFLVLLIAIVELRVLAERFSPILMRDVSQEARAAIRGALLRAVVRLSLASALALLIPIFAADLAVAGTVPLTTIPTALILAGGLVTVIMLLALFPRWQRGRGQTLAPFVHASRGKP